MAAPEDYKGWFLALDLASTQPGGLDQQYATYVDQSGGPTNGFGTRMVIENDADLSYGASIGYAWGALGGLAVSYWGFDNEDEVVDSVTGSLVYPTVFGMYAFNYGQSFSLGNAGYFPVDLTATGKVQASTIDIDYFRPMQAGEKLTITWVAGLRSATFEEDRTFDGADTSGVYYIETKHIESDGFGVKLGATAMFGFTDHFGLQGSMAFSFLQATIDAVATRNVNGINFDEVTSILRYFERQDMVRRLRDAPPESRSALWREFWKETDPVPLTPENEALNEYFRRVQLANVRYREEQDAGWLTDRGEVYISLGDPDDVLDLSHELNRGSDRIIRWQYTSLRLTLFFRDQSGFGRFRLTPTSRAEYQRVLARVRRQQ